MEKYDVCIAGGGLAGLTLALQLRRTNPSLRVLVAERQARPAPEAAFKVGESVSDIGSHYLATVLDLKDHLEREHLRKLMLRFFLPSGDNLDIARRVELGPSNFLPMKTYQLDRGRFENRLLLETVRHGAEVLTGCRVRQVDIDAVSGHRIRLEGPEGTREVSARWVVDASGRPGLLKRQFGLSEPSEHLANSAWFRVAGRVDVDDWSAEPRFRDRIGRNLRWLSTNHLTGPGYWVWIIPLGSGATSIGVVADAEMHDFEQLRSAEAMGDWLRRHEPQCAAAADRLPKLDFRVQRQFSHGCRQLFSSDRWCIVGDAGYFFDPLYSVGTDVIAIINSMITDLVIRDTRGEDVAWAVELADNFMQFYFPVGLTFFHRQYPLMGNPQAMVAKVVWDTSAYWAVVTPAFVNGAYQRWEFLPQLLPLLARFSLLHLRAQEVLREWALTDSQPDSNMFVNINQMYLLELNRRLTERLGDAELLSRLGRNLDYLEALLEQIEARAGAAPTVHAADDEVGALARAEMGRMSLRQVPVAAVVGR